MSIIWTGFNLHFQIIRILLSRPGLSSEAQASKFYPNSLISSCEEIDVIAAAITVCLEGEAVDFLLEITDFTLCSEFQQSVLRATHAIPRGSVSTYQLIATNLDMPQGARAVGNALANNPFPIIVPCHRIIRTDRHPGGYAGGREMKRSLLEKEGIIFDHAGRSVSRIS